MKEYWNECISEALDEVGIQASEKQIKQIAEIVQGAHENSGTALGHDVIFRGRKTEADIQLEKIKSDQERLDSWINSTTPCPVCHTSGFVGLRQIPCEFCGGEGRIPLGDNRLKVVGG